MDGMVQVDKVHILDLTRMHLEEAILPGVPRIGDEALHEKGLMKVTSVVWNTSKSEVHVNGRYDGWSN
jgi:hypothetical protein